MGGNYEFAPQALKKLIYLLANEAALYQLFVVTSISASGVAARHRALDSLAWGDFTRPYSPIYPGRPMREPKAVGVFGVEPNHFRGTGKFHEGHN